MSLWKIAWRSIQQRSLASSLTALSMALGVALVVAVLVIYGVVESSFKQAAHGYDMIVGAKGGKLQLVLNTVFHLSQPIENIPWAYYQEFLPGGRFASRVEAAIPYCLGDNFEGFRVVGTVPEMFTKLEYASGKRYEFSSGQNFAADGFFEAVLGSVVARRTGLKVGDTFAPTHGIGGDGEGKKHDEFKIVGILAPTGTPNDRAVFVNIEGFFLLEGHAKPAADKPVAATSATAAIPAATAPAAKPASPTESAPEPAALVPAAPEPVAPAPTTAAAPAANDHAHPQPLPAEQREVTAILVKSTLVGGLSLPRTINKEPFAQSVAPVQEINILFTGLLGAVRYLLFGLAVLVVIVSGIGIMVSIYNSMSDRRHDIAVMRALGASRGTVMAIILLESILLAVGGGLAGVLLGHGLIVALNPFLEAQTGVSIKFFQFERIELVLIPALIALAAMVGYLPALVAYRTDVAGALSERP